MIIYTVVVFYIFFHFFCILLCFFFFKTFNLLFKAQLDVFHELLPYPNSQFSFHKISWIERINQILKKQN